MVTPPSSSPDERTIYERLGKPRFDSSSQLNLFQLLLHKAMNARLARTRLSQQVSNAEPLAESRHAGQHKLKEKVTRALANLPYVFDN